jgi:CelD/BcsL family acetyltransferase involved in cellulose biosynthesis
MADWSVDILSDVEDYQAARAGLIDLHHATGAPWSVVGHPDWVSAWWSTRPTSQTVRCFVARSGGRTAVSIPCQFSRERFAGLRVRKAASTNLEWGWTSAAIPADTDRGWIPLLLEWLASEAPRWTALEIGAIPERWGVAQDLHDAMTELGWSVLSLERNMAVVDLPGSMEEFLQQRGRNMRQRFRRLSRRYPEHGLHIEVHSPPSASHLSQAVRAVSEVSWQGQEGSAVSIAERDFYPHLLEADQTPTLTLGMALTDAGACVAYSLWAGSHGTLHLVDTGFDPRAKELSPGFMTTLAVAQWAIENGFDCLDLGETAEYKERYRPLVVKGHQLRATRGLTTAWSKATSRWTSARG